MKRNDSFPRLYMDDFYTKIVVFCCIILALLFKQWIFAGCMLIALIVLFVIGKLSHKRNMQKIHKYLDTASKQVSASESISGFPFPAVSVTQAGKIMWYNIAMENLLEGTLLFQKNITEYVKDFSIDKINNNTNIPIFTSKIRNNIYAVYAHFVPTSDDAEKQILLYFIDVTNEVAVQNKYEDSRFVSMIVTFDNYEEVMQGISDSIRNSMQGKIDQILVTAVSEVGGIIKKVERDKYIVSLSMAALRQFTQKKFLFLDEVRDIKLGNLIAPTLSVGVGVDGETYHDCNEYARAALDMALGRGGDQVVIKNKTEMHYFGGKTREVEKRTKVKARVVAYALRELILQSSNVIITGHNNPDADCVGAAMGLVAIVRQLGKRANILMRDCDNAAAAIVKSAQATAEYKNIFIKRNMLEELVSSKTLLIITDTNASSYMEEPDCLQIFSQIALIDHHRKSPNFIKDAVLVYHEPYASSTSEMITEMLPYLDNKNYLMKVEAEALFAGIYLDTKGFAFKTGVRTLEAATYLRRAGVEPISVKQFFKNDLKSYTQLSSLIQETTVYYDSIAIADTEEERSPSLIAKTADELLNIANIDTAFVLAQHDGNCIISGRSTGELNVQVILEKLGGGGHFSVAGAQIKDTTTETVKMMLLDTLKSYFAEK